MWGLSALGNLASFRPRRLVQGLVGVTGFLASAVGILAAFHAWPFQDSEGAIAAAARKLEAAGSARVYVTSVFREDGASATLVGGGEIDFRAETGEFTYGNNRRWIFKRPILYTYGFAKKPLWCLYDVSRLGAGVFFGALTAFSPNPVDALHIIAHSADYRAYGREQFEGSTVTRYSGSVDVAGVVAQESRGPRKQLLQRFVHMYGPRLHLDLLLSRDKTVRRLATSLTRNGVRLDLAYQFADYGVSVVVTDPAPQDTANAGQQGCPRSPPGYGA